MAVKNILLGPIDRAVARIVGLYLVLGLLWILSSDTVGAVLFSDTWHLTQVQSLKGLMFVLGTGLLLAVLLSRHRNAALRSQALLREEHRKLRTLMSNLPGMAYRCANDPKWTMEFVSTGCMELTGYYGTDLQRDRVVAYGDLIHIEDRAMVWEEVQAALAERRPFQIVYRILPAGGGQKWVWEQGRGVFAPSGELLGIEGFISDISRFKHLEAEVHRTRQAGAG